MASATLAFAQGFTDATYKLIEVDDSLLQVRLKPAVCAASRGRWLPFRFTAESLAARRGRQSRPSPSCERMRRSFSPMMDR